VVRGTRESDVEMTARDSFEGAALVLRDRGLADVAESSIRNRSDAWRTPLGSCGARAVSSISLSDGLIFAAPR